MDTLTFIIFGLATWRIASLLVHEDGPLYVFRYIRKLTGIQHDDAGVPYMVPSNFFAQVLSCVWCASFWIGFAWLGFWLLYPEIAKVIAIALSFSTVAIATEKFLRPD